MCNNKQTNKNSLKSCTVFRMECLENFVRCFFPQGERGRGGETLYFFSSSSIIIVQKHPEGWYAHFLHHCFYPLFLMIGFTMFLLKLLDFHSFSSMFASMSRHTHFTLKYTHTRPIDTVLDTGCSMISRKHRTRPHIGQTWKWKQTVVAFHFLFVNELILSFLLVGNKSHCILI